MDTTEHNPAISSPRRFSIRLPKGWSILDMTLAVAPVMAVLAFGVYWLYALAANMTSNNNLRKVGLALHQYHDSYGCFPPAHVPFQGRAEHSWRALFVPHL